MRINKMTATFGKLKNSELALKPGLNVVYAPNEYGKSTWCGFIKAMLYGIDTSDRDKIGYLSPKTRYRPWDGDSMRGTMEITHNGRDITLRRQTSGAAPMKNFLAVYKDTAEAVSGLTGETVGETLTGVPERVFERTAFIRRPDLRINQTAELEKRISSLVSTGEECASYSDTDALLRKWQRKLKVNRSTGSIPMLEHSLTEAERRMQELEASADQMANLRVNIDRLRKQKEVLERDLISHDKLEKRSAGRRLFEARAKMLACQEQADELIAEVTRSGHRITREDVNNIRETAASVEPLRAVRDAAEKNLWNAEKELSDILAKKNASPLVSFGEEMAESDLGRARELTAESERAAMKRIPKWVPIALITVGAVIILMFSGLLHGFTEMIPYLKNIGGVLKLNIPGLTLGILTVGAGAALHYYKPGPKKICLQELSVLFEKYGVNSADKLASVYEVYSHLCREEEVRRAARDAAKQQYEEARQNSAYAEESAVSHISRYLPEVREGVEIADALKNMEKLLDELTHAEFEKLSSQSVYETLAAEFSPENMPEDDEYIPIPIRNREDTRSALERVKSQLSETTRAYDTAMGERRALGDPAVLEGEIYSLREKLGDENKRYSALELAQEVLKDANTELQTRFSPLISKRAGEIMSILTDGRYEKLAFDRDFGADARTADDSIGRPVLALSEGTMDEIYLSLRLSMCEMVLDGEEPCPVILDDALANFDDERCKRALDLLLDLSKKRQMIIFTCHDREGAYLESRGVNIITG